MLCHLTEFVEEEVGVGHRLGGCSGDGFGNEVRKQLVDIQRRLKFAMHYLLSNVLDEERLWGPILELHINSINVRQKLTLWCSVGFEPVAVIIGLRGTNQYAPRNPAS